VGYDAPLFNSPRKTLIEHWNGTRWKHVASPNPGDPAGTLGSVLTGVTATSASNVWAVGDYSDSTATLTLTARWNGTAWKQVASPNPAGTAAFDDNGLNAVAATSAANVWAVGSWTGGALAIHRCLAVLAEVVIGGRQGYRQFARDWGAVAGHAGALSSVRDVDGVGLAAVRLNGCLPFRGLR
jgi:hypothetical protein